MSDWGKEFRTRLCVTARPRDNPTLIKISWGHFNIKQQNMGQSKPSSIISALHRHDKWQNWSKISNTASYQDNTYNVGLTRRNLAMIRDSNGISKLPQIQLILPYKISCIKGSSDIPLKSLHMMFSIKCSHHAGFLEKIGTNTNAKTLTEECWVRE